MTSHWQPSASLAAIRARAELYQAIRQFFAERHVLEVETPVACQHGVTDVHIQNFALHNTPPYYLQTSPEYAMKRLLAAGSGDIFQICKAFRHEEAGRQHNPEFSLLEWYRLNYTHHDLMNEVDELLQTVLASPAADRISYQHLFLHYLDCDPFACSSADLLAALKTQQINITHPEQLSFDSLLQLLLTHVIEPQIGKQAPLMIYDFPASQAALAKIRDDQPRVAERFEVYYGGYEIANGFHELCAVETQLQRFQEDNSQRQALGLNPMTIDPYFIAALEHGLPTCAGVAVGLDRLLMIKLKAHSIRDVLTFSWDQA